MAEKELNEDPRSTWGASAEYKARWKDQYGSKEEKSSDSTDEAPVASIPPGGAEGNQPNDPMRKVATGGVTP
jgi:hypothetical protein